MTRYWHQNGYHVERRFGWDTHGLPVEHEIDKEYGIKGPEDVAKIGIAEYNRLCRSIVMRHRFNLSFQKIDFISISSTNSNGTYKDQ